MKRLVKIIKQAIKYFFEPEALISRNNIAFAMLMSLAPIIALFTIVSLHTIQDSLWLQQYLTTFLPSTVVDNFINVGLYNNQLSFFPFIISILVSLYAASRGFYAIIVTFAKGYQNFNVYHATIQSLIAPFIFVVIVMIIVFSNAVIAFIIPSLSNFLGWLISLGISFLVSLLFFYITSYPRKLLKEIYPGAIVLTVGLTMMSNGFFYIIYNFFNYNDIYGSLAYLLIMLLSLVLIASIMYFAHCVNLAVSENEKN